ncbi:MAG: peptidase S10, partial [Candidatus Kariarchaeaceae archaeon]
MTENNSNNDKNNKKNDKEKPEIPEDQEVITNHSVTIDGKEIKYTVKTGTVVLKEEQEEKEPKATASIFYIAYTRDDVNDVGKRPITYSFNGGPGSSSVWLHLGVLGPRRVDAEKDGLPVQPVPPPYKLVDNEYSLLDLTDL